MLIRDEHGSTILEGAIAIPIFVGLILAIINIAIMLNNYTATNAAARDAAATLGRTADATLSQQVGTDVLRDIGFMGNGAVSVTQPRKGDKRVYVKAEYTTTTLAPGFGALLGGKPADPSLTVRSDSSAILEYQYRTDDPYEARYGECWDCSCQSGGCPYPVH